MFEPFLFFFLCAAVIFFAGMRLSFYGDIIAEKTGWGKAWFGLTLMAAVTSLPELTVGISSVRFVGSADLAVGDVLGSCVFNLVILSLLDAITPGKPLLGRAEPGQILAAAFSVLLLSLVGMGLFLKDMSVLFSVSELVIFIGIALYFISVWLLFKYESKIKLSNTEENAASRDHLKISLKQAVLYYAVLAVIVVGAAIVLPHFANKIAVYTGLGESFTATLFLAAATSLPEVAVSVGAIKLGLPGIAIGNLIGSNLFNMLILFVDDLFYKGSLLKDAAGDHIISVFSILLMTGVVIIGFIYRAHTKKFVLAWETLTILILYVVNMILLYAVR